MIFFNRSNIKFFEKALYFQGKTNTMKMFTIVMYDIPVL